jgi:SAM-dependent methyltransferase
MYTPLKPDNFINIPIGPANVDYWIARTSILLALRSKYPLLRGKLLDVGCGRMPYRNEILTRTSVDEYTGLDIENALVYDESIKPDVLWDGVSMPFTDGSFDCVLATEVFEHVPEINVLLKEIKRVMKTGAALCFTTPFIWPYHEQPNDRQRWTAFGLAHHFERIGFQSCEIISCGNWHSSLAQMLGLWVARAPINRYLRRLMRWPVFRLQCILMYWDSDSNNAEDGMPRMIIGTVKK